VKVITRQLTKEILVSSTFVMVALLALFAFFDLVGQSSRIGTRYDIYTGLQFALFNLPRRFYQAMPIAALLSGIYTLSRWASESVFTVLRISGLSAWRLTRMLCLPAFVMIVLTYIVGEWLAPYADKVYADMRRVYVYQSNTKSTRGFASGVWVKDVVKNARGEPELVRFVNVRSLSVGENQMTGAWRVFEFSAKDRSLKRVIHASGGRHSGNGWRLKNVKIEALPKMTTDDALMTEKATTQSKPELFLLSDMRPDLLNVLTINPAEMGILELRDYIGHLKETRQASARYEIELWIHVFYPLAIFVMLMVATPFSYLNVRSGGMAIKIFAGLMIGITFYAFNNIFSFVGTVNTSWPAFVGPLIPTALMLVATGIALWLVERR